MTDKTYKQIKTLLNNVAGTVEEMGDDSNLFYDDLQKLTNLIRSAGANKKQMQGLISRGQFMIDSTDEADFMASYKSGKDFEKYVNQVLDTLK